MTTTILILGGMLLFAVGLAAVFSAGAKSLCSPTQPTATDELQPVPGQVQVMQVNRPQFVRDLGIGVGVALVAVLQWMAAVVINLR